MASEELPPLVLENPDEYQGKDIEDVLKAWKKDQAVMKSTRIMLLLVFKSKTELASEASARASAEHELYVKAETALARERADTTIVVANRAWLEHVCLQYIKDYRTATYQKNGQRPPLPIPDSDIKNTSITNVFTEHVLGLVFTPAQATGAHATLAPGACAHLQLLEGEIKALRDRRQVEGALATLWNDLSATMHNIHRGKEHGLYIGNSFPTNAALALVVLQAQTDGKLRDVFFYTQGGKVTAKLEGGTVTPGAMDEQRGFVATVASSAPAVLGAAGTGRRSQHWRGRRRGRGRGQPTS